MSGLKIALLADELTRSCLAHECTIIDVPATGFAKLLRAAKPDLLLVESAWHGVDSSWKYKIASYPGYMLRSNRRLRKLVSVARDLHIPTMFWNKEDGVHFDRFIASARLFEHVFTVDANCVPRYRAALGSGATVGVLPFPVQPKLHNFSGFNFRSNDANFVGSYSTHIHEARRAWQNMAFGAVRECGLGLTIYDRNSDRASQIYRYPEWEGLVVRPAVPHTETAQIYKDHLISLNVNTVTDSPTMVSRRLVEILACGGIAVTSAARSIEAMFRDFCHVVSTPEEARALFGRLRSGPSPDDLDRAREGAAYVAKHHTWAQRLELVAGVAGL
ncbi:MAG: glycosyltransferase [Novosphingobium sp.]